MFFFVIFPTFEAEARNIALKILKVVEQKLFLISVHIFFDYRPNQFLSLIFLHIKSIQPNAYAYANAAIVTFHFKICITLL
jgi:hypothetical protein